MLKFQYNNLSKCVIKTRPTPDDTLQKTRLVFVFEESIMMYRNTWKYTLRNTIEINCTMLLFYFHYISTLSPPYIFFISND